MKNILISIIIGALTVSCEKQPKAEVKTIGLGQPIEQIEVAVITTQYGDMVVNFFDQAAPMHVESFKAHANSGYYNGTIFHRVIPGFVIQGGDPNTKGDDKSRYGSWNHNFSVFCIIYNGLCQSVCRIFLTFYVISYIRKIIY